MFKKGLFTAALAAAAIVFCAPATTASASETTGWRDNGTWYVYSSDGSYYCSQRVYLENSDGKYQYYYFNDEGYKINTPQTGWVNAGGWYYFEDGKEVKSGVKTIGGATYYFDYNGKMVTNAVESVHVGHDSNGKCIYDVYAVDANGVATKVNTSKNDWVKAGDNWGYVQDGKLVEGKFVEVNGKWYYFNYNGIMVKDGAVSAYSETEKKSDKYLFDADGALVTNDWYFKSNGTYGDWYYAGADGKAYAAKYDNKTDLLVEGTGWAKINGSWYFFNGSGQMYQNETASIKNRTTGKSETYRFDASGRMVTGWYNRADSYDTYNSWEYYDESGAAYTGWLSDAAGWYYVNNGDLLQGQAVYWVTDENGVGGYSTSSSYFYTYKTEKDADGNVKYVSTRHNAADYKDSVGYFFNRETGAMITGWYSFNSWTDYAYSTTNYTAWYHAEADGSIHQGWLYDGGSWYYLDSDGRMVTNAIETVYESADYNKHMQNWRAANPGYTQAEYNVEQQNYRNAHTYYFGEDGKMVTGWYSTTTSAETTWHYLTADGNAYTGWVQSGDDWYYIRDGLMTTNYVTPDGYVIGADGVWR